MKKKGLMTAIVKKEVLCVFRDKRTMALIMLLPLLLAPALLSILKVAINSSNMPNTFRLATNRDHDERIQYLIADGEFTPAESEDTNADTLIKQEKADLYARINDDGTITLVYNSASTASAAALSSASAILQAWHETRKGAELYETYGVPLEESISSFRADYEDVYGDEQGSMIIVLIPMLVLSYCCYGVSCVAGEMTVTERENGTYDPLIATGVDKKKLLFGKLSATAGFGWISGILAFTGLYLFSLTDRAGILRFDFRGLMMLGFSALLISAMFSSLLILFGLMAKSYKEYQGYSSILAIISMIPTYFTMTSGINTCPDYYYYIPLLNHTLLIRETITGQVNAGHFVRILMSTLALVLIAAAIILYMIREHATPRFEKRGK